MRTSVGANSRLSADAVISLNIKAHYRDSQMLRIKTFQHYNVENVLGQIASRTRVFIIVFKHGDP